VTPGVKVIEDEIAYAEDLERRKNDLDEQIAKLRAQAATGDIT
jgi:hypothetical protein